MIEFTLKVLQKIAEIDTEIYIFAYHTMTPDRRKIGA